MPYSNKKGKLNRGATSGLAVTASWLELWLSAASIGNELAFCSSRVLAAAVHNQAAVNLAADSLVAAEKHLTQALV